ncbi:MAG: tripartite tricarboxylate transporter substrate binding protein [Burkholderiales bacterium]
MKLIAFVLIALLAGPALAAFPERPITLIVPFSAGGATDVMGRILARAMGNRLGQTVIVENKAGADTAIGATALMQSAPDGYTLLISSNSTFTINPSVNPKVAYNPARFEGIGLIGAAPLVLLARSTLAASSVADVVRLARQKPGALTYASFGAATSAHLAGEIFKLTAGVNLLHVPYKGSAPAMQDLMAGQVDLSVDTAIAARAQLAIGKIKAIAVMGSRRSKVLPNVPTVAESGYPGFAVEPWAAIVAPRGLPPAVQSALVKALADSVADPAVRVELENVGMDVAYEPPAAYDDRLARELPQMRTYVHKAKITLD